MASIKLLVKKHNVSKNDKKSPIYAQYNYNRDKRILINTNRRIKLKYWDFENDKVKRSHPNHDIISHHIKKIKRQVETIVSNAQDWGIDPSPEYVLSKFYNRKQDEIQRGEKDFFEHFDEFIASSKGRVGKSTIDDYNALKKHLLGFQKWLKTRIDFSDIDYGFYQKLIRFLTYQVIKPNGEKGLATNTVGKQIKNLRIFLKDCVRKNIIDPIDMSDFKILQEEVDHIYLTEKEIGRIYTLDLSQEKEFEKIRDLFVLGCYTGLRFSDLNNINPANIKGDFIQLKQSKTMNSLVIPLNEVAQEIIQRYDGEIPKGIQLHLFNEKIKLIGKIAGINEDIIFVKKRGAEKIEGVYTKYELIASHTCRRSFCTNE